MERLGPYRLEQTINVGSIGEVFLAYRDGDPPGHAVVVKRLHRELARRPEHVALFVQEGVMARRLEHRNLVRALCAGEVAREAEGAPPDHYIAMDLVRGPNLAQLAERGPVPAAAALRIAVDLCAGLAYMHDSGIVHCDVSPTNVLIGPDRALLTDFGVTCPVGTAQEKVRGTTAYMSPEQARGQVLDGRSDLFSLATVIWELIARRPLFLRSAPYLTLMAVVEEDVPPLGVAGTEAAEAVLRRALSRDPAARWPTAAAMAEALAAAAASAT